MIKNQRKNINVDNKLYLKDMQRISQNINSSIFEDKCSIWQGKKNQKVNNKGYYINFFFNKKKMSLHRILYINYIGELNKNEYLKFTCPNNGICCNINHYSKKNNNLCSVIIEEPKLSIKKIPSNGNLLIEEDNNKKLKLNLG